MPVAYSGKHTEMFYFVFSLNSVSSKVLNTLEEIQERHDAVREIEKKLLELHQVTYSTKT